MTDDGLTLVFREFERAPSSWSRQEAHRALLKNLLEFIEWYITDRADERIWKNFLNERAISHAYREGTFEATRASSDERLRFHYDLPPRSELSGVQRRVARHWLELALASREDEIRGVAAQFGLEWLGPSIDRESLLFSRSDGLFIQFDDRLFEIQGADRGTVKQSSVVSDRGSRAYDSLSAERQRLVYDTVLEGVCRCSMCTLLRPDDEVEEALCDTVRKTSHPDTRISVGWLLKEMVRPSEDVLEALIYASDQPEDDIGRMFVAFTVEAATHVQGSTSELRSIIERARQAFSESRNAAGMAATIGLARQAPQTWGDEALDDLVDAFEAGGIREELAYEYAGEIWHPGSSLAREHVADRLLERLAGTLEDRSRQAALHSLVELYLEEGRVPERVDEVFREHVDHPDREIQQLAERAVRTFDVGLVDAARNPRSRRDRSSGVSHVEGAESSLGSTESTEDAWWRETTIPRHDLSDRELEEVAERHESRADKMSFMCERPMPNATYLQKLADTAHECAAYGVVSSSDDGDLREALRARAQSLESLLRLATGPTSKSFELQINEGDAVMAETPTPRPDVTFEQWLDGFSAAASLRMSEVLDRYVSISWDTLDATSREHGRRPFALARLLALAWRDTSTTSDPLARRLGESYVDEAEWESNPVTATDRLDCKIRLALALIEGTPQDLHEALVQTLECHKIYVEARDDRRLAPESLLPLHVVAIATMAWDRGCPVEVDSPYLPGELVRHTET